MGTRNFESVFKYQDKNDPTRVMGEVDVLGSKTIDLKIKHKNFKVILSRPAGMENLDVYHSINTSQALLGSFSINVKEKAGRLVVGGKISDPTTPSTQATGAGGTTALRVNVAEVLHGAFGGSASELAAAADTVLANGDIGLTNGKSVVVAVVVKIVSGDFVIDKVVGTPATTGSQTSPSDATIQTALGAGVLWLRLCDVTANRTGDTSITQSQNNKVRYTGKNSQTTYRMSFIAIIDSPVPTPV